MNATDIQQLDYAFGKARERIEELQAQLKEANAGNDALVNVVLTHEATIKDLRTQVESIPWDAIRRTFNAADNDGYYNDDVAEWLMKNGVQP